VEPNERPAAAPAWGTANPHLMSARPPAWSPPAGEDGPAPAGGPQAPWAAPASYAPPLPPRRNGIGGYLAVALVTACLVALVTFAGGVVVGGLVVGAATVGSSNGSTGSTGPLPTVTTNPGDPTGFGLFHEAWDILRQHYVDQPALQSKDLTYGAIRGLTEAIGDTDHTRFLTPDELAQQKSDLSG
jgi:hypothetical protein